jgi:hypothetical protein
LAKPTIINGGIDQVVTDAKRPYCVERGALWDAGGARSRLRIVSHARSSRLASIFEGVRPGLWVERMDAGGKAGGDPAPATSLCHLTAALTDHAVLVPAPAE